MALSRVLAAAAAAVTFASAAGSLGVDVSQPVSAAAAECMAAAGRTFSITRAWESVGAFDSRAPATMRSFAAAGVEIAIYMFPCSFTSPVAQLAALQGNLTAANAPSFTMMWFDVETNVDKACAWRSLPENCAYMKQLVAAARANPFFANRTGVYTSTHEWSLIMGATCIVGDESLPLWYPHYESPPNPTFSDFVPYGGWTTPTMKQYADGPALCKDGPATDLNWRPDA